MTSFRVTNVLDDLGPFGECTKGCLNWDCLTLKSLSWATESPVRMPCVEVGIEMTSIELENCLSAEEVYLLDKRTSTYRN